MAIEIRPADPADAGRIADLLGQLRYPATSRQVRARMDDWLSDRHSLLLVAELDGAVAGVAALHAMPLLEHDGRRGRLVALAVDDACRGRDVGRALVTRVERDARWLGCRELEITSARDRGGAHSFYRALGYVDVSGRAARFVKELGQRGHDRSDETVDRGRLPHR